MARRLMIYSRNQACDTLFGDCIAPRHESNQELAALIVEEQRGMDGTGEVKFTPLVVSDPLGLELQKVAHVYGNCVALEFAEI